jgi:hypothetical protein
MRCFCDWSSICSVTGLVPADDAAMVALRWRRRDSANTSYGDPTAIVPRGPTNRKASLVAIVRLSYVFEFSILSMLHIELCCPRDDWLTKIGGFEKRW